MCEDTRSIYDSRISDQFTCVIVEKKREAINDYLINNHSGEVGKKLHSHYRSEGWEDSWKCGGVGGRERGRQRLREDNT